MKSFREYSSRNNIVEGLEGASLEELAEMLKAAVEAEDENKVKAIKAAIEKAKEGDKSEKEVDESKEGIKVVTAFWSASAEVLKLIKDKKINNQMKHALGDIDDIIGMTDLRESLDERIKVNTQAICDEAKQLSPEAQAKVFALVLSLQD